MRNANVFLLIGLACYVVILFGESWFMGLFPRSGVKNKKRRLW